jgi:malonyl CoA-acyl carrier protein transacylase
MVMKVWMFPGQGSQSRGMGKELFARFPAETSVADGILGYSIEDLCLRDPDGRLKDTQFTQPALYVVNALKLKAMREERDETADYALGHSLGEFNALHAAGSIDFATGVALVQERGRLMAKAPPGGMAAVIDLSKAQIEAALADMGPNDLRIANYNSPHQCVISGPKDQIARAEASITAEGGRYVLLNTGGAFHSPLMAPAQEEFAVFVRQMHILPPRIPVISNVTARPHGEGIAEQIIRQMTAPVLWSDSIEYLLAQAAPGDIGFEEIGHGQILTGLVASIRQSFDQRCIGRPPAGTPGTPGTPAEKVASWNARHPVGTVVGCRPIGLNGLKTRTDAMLIFPHRAGLYVENYEGYFDLDDLTAG